MLPDAGQRDYVNDNSTPEQREVKCGEEEKNVPGLAGELSNGPQGVVTYPATGVILKSDFTAENQRKHGQEETPHPGQENEDRCPFTSNDRVLVQRPEHRNAALDRQQEDGCDGDEGAPGENWTDDVARVKSHRL